MKIIKYITFLSSFCGIFFVIYRQSGRWGTSFKIASLIAAGLINVNTDPANAELPGNNTQVYHERLVLENSDQQVILVKTPSPSKAPSVRTAATNTVWWKREPK